MELIQIAMRLTGARESAAEARAASGAIASTGAAATTAGTASATAASRTDRHRRALSALGRVAGTGALAGVVALGVETVRSVNAYREARKVALQTNAVIKSTGGVANVTAKQVGDLANTLSLKTGVDDEEIQSATNMLLTFTNIRNEAGKGNDILNQTTQATLDLAAATKTDAVSAAKQLGKALNDPATGLTALRRSGASFNEEQTEMIQNLFESGNKLKAQKMILSELNKEFKGSARSQNDAVDRLGVAWENLEEAAGKALWPLVSKAAKSLGTFVTEMRQGEGAGGEFVSSMKGVGSAIGDVIGFVRRLSPIFEGLWKITKSAVGRVLPIFNALTRGVGGVVDIIAGILTGDWKRVWEGAKNVAGGAFDFLKAGVRLLVSPFRWAFNTIKNVVGDVVGWIGDKISWVVDKLSDAKNTLEDLMPGGNNAADLGAKAFNTADGAVGAAADAVDAATDAITGGGNNRIAPPSRFAAPSAEAAGGRAPAGRQQPQRAGERRGGNRRPVHFHFSASGRELAHVVLDAAEVEAALA